MPNDITPFVFEAKIVLDGRDAFLLNVGQKENVWFPKPLTQRRGASRLFVVPTWFAELKHLTRANRHE